MPRSGGSTEGLFPAGERIAYTTRGQDDDPGANGLHSDEVWIAPAERERGTRSYVLTTEMRDERLVELSWAPDGQHLFLVTRYQLVGGGYRTRLLWLDTSLPRAPCARPTPLVSRCYHRPVSR